MDFFPQDDLGGPLMIHHHDCMVQIGVVRFDSNCPTPASARPYINTASFADFIKNVTQSEPACMVPVFPGKNPEAGFKCPPTETPKPPKCPNPSSPDCNDDSVFSSGVNVISSFRIISLCLLGFMFYSTY
ncbi:Hypothetical predicted protein [Xyrichtys novacula]|uniref:Uncharacterized protein n=1 Tax=Xyrichtys novacula TaxID=13765 RepID=A0AAV1HIH8_XYRNO|nr:Hypothetical predicted protein [Xyrichtys novacula]